MDRARSLVWAAAIVLAAAPAFAEDERPTGREHVWQGYLYRDDGGRIQIGWPVIAKGVVAQPAHVVGGPLAAKLGPLVSAAIDDSYVFWNYSLETDDGVAKVPRVLVRLRGRVTVVRDEHDPFGDGPRTMPDARLEAVEILSDGWLATWARIFRLEASPWVIRAHDDPLSPKERAAKLAPEVLAIVKALRAHAGPTDEQRRLVASIAPDARIIARHRVSSERSLVRWLRTANAEHGLGLERLDELGALPPDPGELAKWFREAKSKAAFFERVRGAWPGDLEEVDLAYYLAHDGGVTLRTIDLARVWKEWSDETFLTHRDSTVKIATR